MTASKTVSFDLELTKDMSPSFDYIAYYIEASGKVVFDRIKIKVQQQPIKVNKCAFLPSTAGVLVGAREIIFAPENFHGEPRTFVSKKKKIIKKFATFMTFLAKN